MEETRTFEFENIPLNLQQGMIRAKTLKENTINQVVAIYSHHKRLLLIRVDWRDQEEEIKKVCPIETCAAHYADSFHIDTWDNRLDKYNPYIPACPNCGEKYQKGNYCSNCGERL